LLISALPASQQGILTTVQRASSASACRDASFQRQRLLQAVERVQASKKWAALASGNLDGITR